MVARYTWDVEAQFESDVFNLNQQYKLRKLVPNPAENIRLKAQVVPKDDTTVPIAQKFRLYVEVVERDMKLKIIE